MMIDSYTALQYTDLLKRHDIASRRNQYEKLHNLEYLSGLTVDELVVLFAAGYTLEPPKPDRDIREAAINKMYEEIMYSREERIKRLTEILEKANYNATSRFDKKKEVSNEENS